MPQTLLTLKHNFDIQIVAESLQNVIQNRAENEFKHPRTLKPDSAAGACQSCINIAHAARMSFFTKARVGELMQERVFCDRLSRVLHAILVALRKLVQLLLQ